VRELRRAREGRTRPPAALALLADPVFGADDPRLQSLRAGAVPAHDSARVSGTPFPRLSWTRKEAEGIAAAAQGRDLLLALGFEASRELAGSEALSRYRIVHFATHGVLDTQHPALSGLVLSQMDEQGRARDGYLRLHDVYGLRLNADLVVLSGCETALGKTLRGEGIVGLTRGFFHSGASQVLASLWPVRDRATAELMHRFYRAMFREGLAPSAALRQAQISLWKERPWRDPYFWAAFTLQGDWKVEAP
jgi:CHAT domain-containing protein